jgi:conjugal transfer mating pair stabilization protein TraG
MSSEEQASAGRVISDLQQLSQYYQTSHHMTRSEADAEATRAGVTAYAQAEAGAELPGGFASVKAGVKGEASKDASTTATQAKSNDRGFSLTDSLSTEIADSHSRISTDAARSAFDRSHSTDRGQRHVDSSTFSSLESITDTATRLRATGNRLSEDASNVKSGSESVSGNEGTAFFNWMIHEKGLPVQEARSLWIGATSADLQRGMALAQEYNNAQAESLASKYDAAATPSTAPPPMSAELKNADAGTAQVAAHSDLRPSVPAQASPTTSKGRKRKASGSSGSAPPAQTFPGAPSLAGSDQAAAFDARNQQASGTSQQVSQEVAQGQHDLEHQQVREHINITDQTLKTGGKVIHAGQKTWYGLTGKKGHN